MAILWADGFEDWTSAAGEYELSAGSVVITAGAGRRGGSACVMSGNGAYIQKSTGSAKTELFASFSLNPSLGTNRTIISFFSGATTQVSLYADSAGVLYAYRGAATTLLGSTAGGTIPNGATTHYQMRAVISDTVGVLQVRLNGSSTPIINLTGIDTNNGAAAVSVDAVRLGGNANGVVGNYDDFVINDTSGSVANSWLGDTRVDSYFPNANGDSSQFVGSDGNSTDNYLLVDAAAPNGTDYVQSSTVNDKDLYGFGNLSHTPTSIFGVLVTAAALKDDAGSRLIRLLAKASGTEADHGADIALSTSRTRAIGLFETNPNTSAAWTKSGVDAAQFGVKVTV